VGYRQAQVATRPLLRDLARLAPQFAQVMGVDAGAWAMARAGLLAGHRATVHWEDLEDFAAAHPEVEVVPDRWVIDGSRATAGGAAPAHDLMLHLIGCRHGAGLAGQVADSFLTETRPGHEPQIAPRRRGPRPDPRVAAAVARMQARLDAPEPVAATARAVGLSPRRLEGLFRAALGQGPGAYGLALRLQAAQRLVSDTRHPLAEIALRTGFSSASALSRAFRARFGVPPSALRRDQAGVMSPVAAI
jgi:transcriptional regulator GlxA family with amidase domain